MVRKSRRAGAGWRCGLAPAPPLSRSALCMHVPGRLAPTSFPFCTLVHSISRRSSASSFCPFRDMGKPEASSGALAKRRKQKHKKSFKADAAEAAPRAAEPQAAQAQALRVTASPALSKRQKRKQKQHVKAEKAAEDVPKAAAQQQQRQQPGSGGAGGGGRQQSAAAAAPPPSRFAPPAAAGGKKKGKGEGVRCAGSAQCRTLPACSIPPPAPPSACPGGGSVLEQMRARLQGGRFRWLNEALYTSDGAAALAMVQKEPEVMQQYHEGEEQGRGVWCCRDVCAEVCQGRLHMRSFAALPRPLRRCGTQLRLVGARAAVPSRATRGGVQGGVVQREQS